MLLLLENILFKTTQHSKTTFWESEGLMKPSQQGSKAQRTEELSDIKLQDQNLNQDYNLAFNS